MRQPLSQEAKARPEMADDAITALKPRLLSGLAALGQRQADVISDTTVISASKAYPNPSSFASTHQHGQNHFADSLLAYLALLHKWNKAYNLTSVRDPKAMLSVHLLDCLATLRPIEAQLRGAPKYLIVGSGGGLPGIIYALAWPDCQVHLVDTVGKKTAFLQQCKQALGLGNLEVHHARIEQLLLPPTGQAGNETPLTPVFTCRAFATLSDFLQQTWHLRQANSVWISLKGQRPADELAVLESTTAKQLSVQLHGDCVELHPPGLEDTQRHLIFVRVSAADIQNR
jgi:16S rRNA (guanine527-N7)-methyltransferase